jgi:tetratricopeptide (TPR) repeat protein
MNIIGPILLLVLIIYLISRKKKQRPSINSNINSSTQRTTINTQPTKSIKKPYPDRTKDITFHREKLREALAQGDLQFANLSFAKLVESTRQQNENLDGMFRLDYEHTLKEYEEFLSKNNLDKPEQFNDPTAPKPKKKFDTSDFYGNKSHSPNYKFAVAFQDSYEEGKKGDVYLLQGTDVLFQKKIDRPNDCVVSNDGIVGVCDWMHTDELAGQFFLFNIDGKQIIKVKTSANLGNCAISEDSKYAIFETYHSDTEDSDMIFIIDIVQKKVVGEFEREIEFKKAKINSSEKSIDVKINSNLTYQVNFDGEWINKEKFEQDLNEKGSKTDKVNYLEILYKDREAELCSNDIYLDALQSNINNQNFKDGQILKRIGEVYENRKDIPNAIKYFQQALDKNPRVGIKTKLTKLIKDNP